MNFKKVYVEAEKNNLDILGFTFIRFRSTISRSLPNYSDKKRIIYQPELSNLMYNLTSNGKVRRFGGNLWNLFVRNDIFKKVVKQIDEKNFNVRMNHHDDFILFFLLTRSAKSIKYIDRIFYANNMDWKEDEKVKFRKIIKYENIINDKCFEYLNFLEILFKNTKNTFEDKKIAFSQLEEWYLNKLFCRNNKNTRERAIEVFKLYLNNEYVSKEDKKNLEDFMNNEQNKI